MSLEANSDIMVVDVVALDVGCGAAVAVAARIGEAFQKIGA